jgi:hypothetical protein
MIKLYLRHGVKGDVIEARILRNALKFAQSKIQTSDCTLCGIYPCACRTACRDIENAISFIDGYLAREDSD